MTYNVNRWTRYADGWRGGSTTSGIRSEQRAREIFADQKARAADAICDDASFLDHGRIVAAGVTLWIDGSAMPHDLYGWSRNPTQED